MELGALDCIEKEDGTVVLARQKLLEVTHASAPPPTQPKPTPHPLLPGQTPLRLYSSSCCCIFYPALYTVVMPSSAVFML